MPFIFPLLLALAAPASCEEVVKPESLGGDFDGDPDAATPFPGGMEIDNVRVFAK